MTTKELKYVQKDINRFESYDLTRMVQFLTFRPSNDYVFRRLFQSREKGEDDEGRGEFKGEIEAIFEGSQR